MKKYTAVLLLMLCTLSAQNRSGGMLAVAHVNIVNVITGKIIPDQTILIQGSKIIDIGPSAKMKLPAGASKVDGSGKYAMPGLTDGHVHFFQSGGLYTRPDGLSIPSVYPYEKDQQWIKDNINDLLGRYLACGITHVVDMGGPTSNFSIRDKANSNPNAPTLLVTGPLISTIQPTAFSKEDPPIIKASTPDEAKALVHKELTYKPDFIKIWYLAKDAADAAKNLPMVKAAIQESHAARLKVCVHATEYETANLAVGIGADILVHSVDDKLLYKPLLTTMKSKNVVYIPTLQVADNYARAYSQRFDFTAHELKYSNPYMLGTMTDLQHIARDQSGIDYEAQRSRPIRTASDSIMSKNLLLANEAGILIVAGTDAGNIGTQHAASLLRELMMMKDAGLTDLEVLRSATINAAKAFGKEKEWGSIDRYKDADILLLDKNPLQGLDALDNIETIIHRGIVIKTAELLDNTPEALVQRQLNAYNSRNVDALLETYGDDAELYRIPSTLLAKGKVQLRDHYSQLFRENPGLHIEILKRTVLTNMVIDNVRLSGIGPDKKETMMVYETENGKIIRLYQKN
jgi:imidazolonepropionase-like amidohydrolase